MTKNKKKNNDIIRDYYNLDSDGARGVKLRGVFAQWFFRTRKLKQRKDFLQQLWEEEQGDPAMWSPQQMEANNRRVMPATTPQRISVPTARKLSRAWMKVAAVVLPLMILATGVWWYSAKQQSTAIYESLYVAVPGEVKDAVLPDGSQTWINADSKVEYKSEKGQERIVMLTGEAKFNVVENKNEPFKVISRDITVEVLGTEFNVEAYPDRFVTIVTLSQGQIKITDTDGERWNLSPNQQLIYDRKANKGVIYHLSEVETAKQTSWLSGDLLCRDMTSLEMLKAVERHSALNIEIDPAVRFSDKRYLVEFRKDATVNLMIDHIQLFDDVFEYEIDGKNIYIKSK